MQKMKLLVFVWCIACSSWHGWNPTAQAGNGVNWEEAPVLYSQRTPHRNPIAKLQESLKAGTTQLTYEPGLGYLRAVLKELEIPAESQVLVFSKTSLQNDKIHPAHPRAIYFNSQSHVGFVREGILEMAVADPDFGMAFYSMDQDESDRPVIYRQVNRCMACHGAARTKGVPGLLIRSVYPDFKGEPIVSAGSVTVNTKTPIANRWGGWYVTTNNGESKHLGNALFVGSKTDRREHRIHAPHQDELKVDMTKYLHTDSDAIALWVLEHQSEFYNQLTIANFMAQKMEYADGNSRSEVEAKKEREKFQAAVKGVMDSLWMNQAVPLGANTQTDSIFSKSYRETAKLDGERQLREFSPTGTFRYSLSPLVYSPVLDGTPTLLRQELHRQLLERMATLPADSQQSLQSILRDSPANWFPVRITK